MTAVDDRYLRPTEIIDSDHPEVVAFSEATVAGETDPREMAVKLYDSLIAHDWLTQDGSGLTPQGKEKFLQLGIDINARTKRKACCPCLDWSERQFHLGGQAGAALLRFFEQQRWIERVIGYREVTITAKGDHALKTHFHVE